MSKLVIATRKSPLALVQAELVAAHLRATLRIETELLKIVTTGDRQAGWSLEQKGGKGLFTGELEQAVLRSEAFEHRILKLGDRLPLRKGFGHRLAVHLGELGLVVERLQVRGAAGHRQPDDPLGLRRMMQRGDGPLSPSRP